MKWDDSVASRCRWSEAVYDALEDLMGTDLQVLWEDSYDDYQGHATVLVQGSSSYCFYEWEYGSCSGCDSWETLPEEDTREEIRRGLAVFTKDGLRKWGSMLEQRACHREGLAAVIASIIK
jgi:hypothetical protein